MPSRSSPTARRRWVRNGNRIRGKRRGVTVIKLHNWATAYDVRRSSHEFGHRVLYTAKASCVTIVTNKRSHYKLLKIFRKIRSPGRVSMKLVNNMYQFNDALQHYRIQYGQSHVELFLKGIRFGKYIFKNNDGSFQVKVRFTKRCTLYHQNIARGGFIVNKRVMSLRAAQCWVVQGLILLNAAQAGMV